MVCNEGKWHFFNFNTDSMISLCVRAHYLRYVVVGVNAIDKHFRISEILVRKKNDFAEFKVHFIHRKQVPLLHNTVLILCDEGAGLVAMLQ